MDPLFEVHWLNDAGLQKAALIADAFSNCLNRLRQLCPECREFSIVKTKIEEANFFAKKSMATLPENQQSPLIPSLEG